MNPDESHEWQITFLGTGDPLLRRPVRSFLFTGTLAEALVQAGSKAVEFEVLELVVARKSERRVEPTQ